MSGFSRRNFLKGTAALAAGTAFPTVLPSRVFGANAPSNRIAVGILGVGAQGRGHFNHVVGNSDFQLVAICDAHDVRTKHFVEAGNAKYAKQTGNDRYKGVRGFKDFRQMLAMPGLDAVIIATPNHWHAVQAVAACRAGKDVFCEKPLADTHQESRAMADAARQYGTVFQTGSMQRSDNTFRFACELVRNGRLGKIKEVWVDIGGPPQTFCDLPAEPVPAGLDWNLWVGPSQWRPYNKILCPDGWDYPGFPMWRLYSQFGGGMQSDWGAHHYDIAQWGLGMDDSGPVDVVYNGPDADAHFTYTYANGIKMYVGHKVEGAGTTWIGEKGTVGVNRGGFLYCDPPSLADVRFGPGDVHLYESASHHQNWIECIKTRRDPICTAEIGHRTSAVCQIGMIAVRLGRKLQWDPKAERFVGDDDANRMLRREMRAPWTL